MMRSLLPLIRASGSGGALVLTIAAPLFVAASTVLATPLPTRPGMKFAASTLPGGGQPFAVVAVDLNRDDAIDLAITNPEGPTVSVYYGRGDGTFEDEQHFVTGKRPRGITTADYNRDGLPDLAIASTDRDAAAVHLGKAGGGFEEAKFSKAGPRPFLLSTGDFNGDGIPDLAVSDEGAYYASILLGNGDGFFRKRTVKTGKWGSDTAPADFNNDGFLDVAVTNWGDNDVSVLLGKGNGRFSPALNFTYKGHALYSVKAGDLDRDGNQDMVWNDIMRYGLYILYGDGTGDFPRTRRLRAGAGVRSVEIADLNGDGWLDLCSTNLKDNNISIILADGEGGFSPTQYIDVGTYPRMVVAADFNGDARPDLAVTNMSSNDVTILINQGPIDIPIPPTPEPTRKAAPLDLSTFRSPGGIALDPAGNLLVADQQNHRIARIEPSTGKVETVAGTGKQGFGGDGGPAFAAELRLPSDVAVDGAGNIYVADGGNNRVRKVDPAGNISTVAGTGAPRYAGDGGPASEAALSYPFAVAVDGAGNLFISDFGNARIRKVDSAGTITTVAGTGTPGFSGNGGPATQAEIKSVPAIALDEQGNLFLVDAFNRRIRKVDERGIITTIAGTGELGDSGDSGPATAARFHTPSGIAIDPRGNLLIADQSGHRIRRITAGGRIQTVPGFAGADDENAAARVWSPTDVAIDRQGIIFFSDRTTNTIQRVDAGGTIVTIAGTPPRRPPPRHPTAAPSTPGEKRALQAPPALDWEHTFRSGSDANAPYAVATDGDDVYVAGDTGTGADWHVLHLDAQGQPVWSYDEGGDNVEIPYALAVSPKGEIIVAGMGVGDGRDDLVVSLSKEGKANWRFTETKPGDQSINGVAVDHDGNIYLAGEGREGWDVFSLTPARQRRWTFHGRKGSASAIDVDEKGDAVVAGAAPSEWRVLKIGPDGDVVWEHELGARHGGTFSTGAFGVRLDNSGNSFVTGTWLGESSSRLRVEKLDPTGKLVWEYIDEVPHSIGRDVAVKPDGSSIVVGEDAEDWLVLGLDADGNLSWRFTHDGGGKGMSKDRALSVALHGDGFVVSGVIHPVPPVFPNLGAVEWRIARYR